MKSRNVLLFFAAVLALLSAICGLMPHDGIKLGGYELRTPTLAQVFYPADETADTAALDPATANEVAWNTATQMVNSIGGTWNLAQIPTIVSHYSTVFWLFALGMAVHWLPEHFKRRYRLWFASLPLWLMAVVVTAIVLVVMQFVSADLQPFIYFQF